MAHLALNSVPASAFVARAGVAPAAAAHHPFHSPVGSRVIPAGAPVPARNVKAGAWWSFGTKAKKRAQKGPADGEEKIVAIGASRRDGRGDVRRWCRGGCCSYACCFNLLPACLDVQPSSLLCNRGPVHFRCAPAEACRGLRRGAGPCTPITTPENHYPPHPPPSPMPACHTVTPTPAAAPLQATKSSQEASPAATSFRAPADMAATGAAASAPTPSSQAGKPDPAAAAAAPPAPASKGRKGGKRKGKKAGKGRPRADAPAATSFQVPAPAGGSDSEGEEEHVQQAEPAQQAALQAAAAEPALAAGSSTGAAAAEEGSVVGSGSSTSRQVVTLQDGTLTVNADGSVSISGPDAAKVLEALAAVGLLPAGQGAGSSSYGRAAGPAAPAVPVRESSEVEYLTGA